MGNTQPRSGHHRSRLSDYDDAGGGEEPWLLKSPPSNNKPSRPLPSLKPGPSPLGASDSPTGPPDLPPWAPAAGYDPLPAHQIVSQLKLRVSILEFLLKKQTCEMEEMKLKNAGVNSKVSELAAKIDGMILSAKNKDESLPVTSSAAAVVDVPNLIDMNDENLPPPQPSSEATVDVPDLMVTDDDRRKSPPADWQLLLKSAIYNPRLVRIDGMSDWDFLLVVFLVFMVVGLLL